MTATRTRRDHVRRHANKHLCILTCLPFQALTQLQDGIDKATKLMQSSYEDKVIVVDEFTKAINQLEASADTVSSWVAGASPAALAAKKLISNLKVKARRFVYARSTQIWRAFVSLCHPHLCPLSWLRCK